MRLCSAFYRRSGVRNPRSARRPRLMPRGMTRLWPFRQASAHLLTRRLARPDGFGRRLLRTQILVRGVMRRAMLCAALAIVFGPSSSGAQSLTMTESEALARLPTSSPRERAIRAGVEVSRADVAAAGRWPNPRLTVDRESVAGVTEYLTMVAQPLPITGRRDLDVQAASALVSARSSRADDEVRRLRADLRLAFADLVSAQTRSRDLTAARDRLRELAGLLAKREAAGDAAGFDRLRAEREVLDLETDLGVATTERTRAQATLAGFLDDIAHPFH
ncbi:MAG: hypothetical protein DMF90_27385, partial [Acidobacteria bacterium]